MKPTSREAARSRRWFLLSIPAGLSVLRAAETGKGRSFPSTLFRYSDASTEFPVLRLTDPAYTSVLPAAYQRAVSKRNFMLYASDVTGRWEAFRMDLKNGQSRQLTEAEALNPASLSLLPDDRGFGYLDGDRLMEASLSTLRAREIYKMEAGWQGSGLTIAEDGLYAAVVEKRSAQYRLQLVHMAKGEAVKLVESDEEIHDPIPRPRRASILYRRAGAAWLADYDTKHDYRLRLAEGESGPAEWSPDGRTILYLNYPADSAKLHNIREFTPDTNEDKILAPTTQFVGFGSNTDASVFVGASGSKASPHVLLLVRAVKRELTLAEHRASDPRMVAPVFSPNSQRVFFRSDQHGKPAIYTMSVERLVEKTEG
jgi:oligogalacturonide lyase